MLQELSAKWRMAASQRGYCKFRAGSFWKHQPLQELLIDARLTLWLQTLPGFPFYPHCISATLSDPSYWEESSSVKLLSVFLRRLEGNSCCLHKITTGLTDTAAERPLVNPPWARLMISMEILLALDQIWLCVQATEKCLWKVWIFLLHFKCQDVSRTLWGTDLITPYSK